MHRVLDRQLAKQNPPGLCALAIMTKAPRAGAVKTRLQPPLTAAEAAELNICFLRDIAEAIAVACSSDPARPRKGIAVDRAPRPTKIARGIGVFTPVGSEKEYANILPLDFDLLPQRGNGFGERLLNAAEDLLRVGFESCCLINSDSPTVTADAFREAATQLQRDEDRIVLGPADDGGYYLIGMRKLHGRLFDEIEWSTGRVFAQTVERAQELRVRVHTLPTFFDVDERATLHRLCDELLGKELCDTVAPATGKFLKDMIAREGRDRIWPVSTRHR
jgi:uncharacterized protein